MNIFVKFEGLDGRVDNSVCWNICTMCILVREWPVLISVTVIRHSRFWRFWYDKFGWFFVYDVFEWWVLISKLVVISLGVHLRKWVSTEDGSWKANPFSVCDSFFVEFWLVFVNCCNGFLLFFYDWVWKFCIRAVLVVLSVQILISLYSCALRLCPVCIVISHSLTKNWFNQEYVDGNLCSYVLSYAYVHPDGERQQLLRFKH